MGANIDRDGQYATRAGNFVNNWNRNVSVPGRPDIKGMMQVTIISSPVLYLRADIEFSHGSSTVPSTSPTRATAAFTTLYNQRVF